MSMPAPPTAKELQQAFEAGAKVRFDLPVSGACRDGRFRLNLVAAMRGDPDPWVVTRRVRPEMIDMASAGVRTLAVNGYRATGLDVQRVERAVAAAPADADRHGQAGDPARLAAGQIALQIRDAHLRAAVLTMLDGWAALCAPERLVDESGDGRLYDPPDDGYTARILDLTCPSTSRRYVHMVPAECRSAAEARRWMLGLPSDAPAPEYET